jgi:D-methionine transport system permease protein
MFFISGIISFVIGLFLGTLLTIFKRDGIKENKIIYFLLSFIINILRSIPFIILLVFLMPFTRKIVGTAIGVRGVIIPLVFGTVPFFARQIETALANVSYGKIEAAKAMGSTTFGLITRVYLKEAVPEIIRVTTITLISLIGLIAVAGGTIGAGGVGDLAVNTAYPRRLYQLMYLCIIVILIMVCIIQGLGSFLAKKTTNRTLFIKKRRN